MAELGFHVPSLIVYLVNFGLLLGVLYLFGYKRILAMLDQRSGRIRDSLEEADRVRREAAQAQEELKAQMEQGRKEGQQLLQQAREAAGRYREEERQRALAEGQEFLDKARQDIQQERDAAIEEVRGHFADLAVTAAGRIISRSLDSKAHRDLIEKVLDDAPELKKR